MINLLWKLPPKFIKVLLEFERDILGDTCASFANCVGGQSRTAFPKG